MHILLLNDDLPSGSSSVCTIERNLQKGYEQAGHRVSIVGSHRVEDSKDIERNGNQISIPVSYRASLQQHLCLYIPSVNKAYTKIISQLQPDIVHAHNIHRYLTYSSLKISSKYAKKVIITLHDVMSFAYARLATKQFLDSKGVDNSLKISDHLKSAELQYNPIRNTYIRHMLNRYVDRIIAPSKALENALQQHSIQKTAVIPNGINLEEWNIEEYEITSFKNKHSLNNRKVILFGGRLSIDKGAIPLLHVLDRLRKEVSSVLLFVAGDQKRWHGLVQAANVSADCMKHIYNPGWIVRKDVILANFAADIATVPSLCLDVFPSTNIEAMAASKPVVGTCFGGTPEVVQHNKTGIIVDPQNEESFYQACKTLLTSEQLAMQMGEAGRQYIEKFYTVNQQAQSYLDIMQD